MAIPQTLYKYQSFAPHVLGGLAMRQVWFSRPSNLNDPLDCNIRIDGPILDAGYRYLFDQGLGTLFNFAGAKAEYPQGHQSPQFRETVRAELEKAIERQVANVRGQRGVCCLSEVHDDALMWSHYADGHKGLCLGFSGRANFLQTVRPVKYAEEPPNVDPMTFLSECSDELFWKMILTKSACWKYEREWRAFQMAADTAYGYEAGDLQTVHFGLNMPDQQRIVIGLLLQGTGTQFFRMTRNERSFKLTAKPLNFSPR